MVMPAVATMSMTLGGIDVVVSGHRTAVTGGDATVEILPHRLEREVFQAARIGIVGVVDQHVDVAIMTFGDVEADIDMLARFRVGVLVPRQAADDVAAFLDRLVEAVGGAGIADDAFLGKGDHFDVAITPGISPAPATVRARREDRRWCRRRQTAGRTSCRA